MLTLSPLLLLLENVFIVPYCISLETQKLHPPPIIRLFHMTLSDHKTGEKMTFNKKIKKPRVYLPSLTIYPLPYEYYGARGFSFGLNPEVSRQRGAGAVSSLYISKE